MTYQEIKDRLSQCEIALEKIKNGTHNSTDVKQKTEKLEILRESYTKLLKEAEKTAFINGNPVEYEKEDELKKYKDNSDVKTIKTAQGKDIKEQEGLKFNVDETKAIAKKVGKAVAMGLRQLGDQVKSMKATNIEEGSFSIEINYKGEGPGDEFSFYIVEDTLHLTDFSFDKELVDVGVKPSGEAIINVDVLANELSKHWKSQGQMEGKYKSDAQRKAIYAAKAEKNEALQLVHVYDKDGKMYGTGSVEKVEGDKTVVRFDGSTVKRFPSDRVKPVKEELAETGELDEAPDGLYYIKVPKYDKAMLNAVQNTIETIYHPTRFTDIVDDDGAGNVIMYFSKEDFEPGMIDDLEGEGVDVSSQTNLPRGLSEDDDDYKYDGEHQGSNYKWPMSQATKDRKEADKLAQDQKDHDEETYDREIGENEAEDTEGGDLDIGHQDDEPDMLKQYAYDIATYASKLYKALDKYDKYDGEVDFPNWWQSKVILARDYISKAQHYLEFEEKQPAIDQLALENASAEEEEKFHKKLDTLVHNTFGKRKEEMDENRFLAASLEDLEQVIRNLAHTGEMSEDEAIELAIRKLEAMLDGRDDLDETTRSYSNLHPSKGHKGGAKKIQKAYDLVVKKMKELAKVYKSGDKSVITQLKDLTAKKRELENMLDSAVANTGKGQELTVEGRGDMDTIVGVIEDRASDSGFDVQDEAIEVIEAIADHYELGEVQFEYQNEAQLNEQATCCGKCGRVHVKGTKCKTPYLKGKDHCRNN